MDLPVNLEDIVKSLAEKALEQEHAAKQKTVHEGGVADPDDSDEHEFDTEQLDQMLKEEKSKKRQTRRARAGGAPSAVSRNASKRKLLGETSSGSKRICSLADDSGEADDLAAGAQNEISASRRPSRKTSNGKEESDMSTSEIKSVKLEASEDNYRESFGEFKHSTLPGCSAVKTEAGAEDKETGDREQRTEYVQIVKSIVKHKRTRFDKAHQDLVKLGCDCYLSPDDIASGRVACCDDSCSNRAVCIECPPKCRLGHACCNQRMQRAEYAGLEIRYAGKKGYGIYATRPVSKGDLIIEYVGEIVSSRQFNKRAKLYEKSGIRHHYFMSLNNDEVIDATRKGNEGRFMNHCCDPNAETQKWIVGGETRIGFFARRDILVGEEFNIDYQFVRFGSQSAARCLCGARNCRGFIGVESSAPSSVARGGKTQFEIDLNKLVDVGAVKTSANALKFAHVFIHATKDDDILTLVRVLQNSEQYTDGLKSFLRLHGLNILHCYMTQLKFSKKPLPLMNEIMAVLQALVDSNAITSRNGLEDSGIMRELDEWAGVRPPQMPVTTVAAAAATPAPAADSVLAKTAAVLPAKLAAAGNAMASPKKSDSATAAADSSLALMTASNLIESTLEELKRDEAKQERARIEKIFDKTSAQISTLDMAQSIETFETGMIECCKAPAAEERRQQAQVMVLKSISLTIEANNKMVKPVEDVSAVAATATGGVGRRNSATPANNVQIKIEPEDNLKIRRTSTAPAATNSSQAAAEIVMDPLSYSSSSDDDDSDDDDDDVDDEDAGEADQLLDMLNNSNDADRSITPADAGLPPSSSLSSKMSGGKFAKHNNSSLVLTPRVKQTPYMRLLTFLNHLERQARVAAEEEELQQRRLARKAEIAAIKEAAAAAGDVSVVSSGGGSDAADDSMDIVDTDEEIANLVAFRANSLGLPSPIKAPQQLQQPQQSAAALLGNADEQFQHDIGETQRLRRYTLEFIDYCKQNLHIVFKIQKRSSAAISHTTAKAKAAAGLKHALTRTRTVPRSKTDAKVKAENNDTIRSENKYRDKQSISSKKSNAFSPPGQAVQQPNAATGQQPTTQPSLNNAPISTAPPTPQALYEQHKKLMSDFIPVLYADEEKRKTERDLLRNDASDNGKQSGAGNLSAAERTAQMFEKQVEKQDMFDAWMTSVKTSAGGASRGTAAAAQSKEAQYMTQHRSQVLQTVMHYMNGTRKQPEKRRVKQEVRQQKQRILQQPNYFMHVPSPHHQSSAAGPRSNQELKASIYSRIQSDICACVAEKVSNQFGQLLNDAKGEELQKRLYVMLPTGERVLLSDNKCTFENQRKYRSLMPLKYGSNDWNFRLLQLKRFPLVREFLQRQAASAAKDGKQQADDSNKISHVPPLCNPTTAGYTSNFDHVFYSNTKEDAENANDSVADSDAGFRLPLPHGINVAFNQQGPKGLLYCWDEETLQSSWLMPSAHLEESIDDFVRSAVPMSSAPPPTIKVESSSRNMGGVGTSTIRLPHEATFTRFVWKDSTKTALPQSYEGEWLDLLHQDAVSLDNISNSVAAAAAATASAAASQQHQSASSSHSQTTTPSVTSGSTPAISTSLAEWQAAAASTLLRRNRQAAVSGAVASGNSDRTSSPTVAATGAGGGAGENGSSSGGGGGETRSRQASGAASGGISAASAEVSTVMLTKAEFRDRVSRHVVNALNPYRKSTCQKGRIRNKDDFKVVARELTHKIVDAEIKRHSEQQLRSNANRCFVYSAKLEAKIDAYINKFMQRFGKVYDPNVPVPSSSSKSISKKSRASTSAQHETLQHSFDDEDELAEQPLSAANSCKSEGNMEEAHEEKDDQTLQNSEAIQISDDAVDADTFEAEQRQQIPMEVGKPEENEEVESVEHGKNSSPPYTATESSAV